MAKELQQILRKYGEKELTGNIIQEIKNMLKENVNAKLNFYLLHLVFPFFILL